MPKPKLKEFFCDHSEDKLRHEVKIIWNDGRSEETFTCTGCGKKIVKKEGKKK